jgi:hypothetical protein
MSSSCGPKLRSQAGTESHRPRRTRMAASESSTRVKRRAASGRRGIRVDDQGDRSQMGTSRNVGPKSSSPQTADGPLPLQDISGRNASSARAGCVRAECSTTAWRTPWHIISRLFHCRILRQTGRRQLANQGDKVQLQRTRLGRKLTPLFANPRQVESVHHIARRQPEEEIVVLQAASSAD